MFLLCFLNLYACKTHKHTHTHIHNIPSLPTHDLHPSLHSLTHNTPLSSSPTTLPIKSADKTHLWHSSLPARCQTLYFWDRGRPIASVAPYPSVMTPRPFCIIAAISRGLSRLQEPLEETDEYGGDGRYKWRLEAARAVSWLVTVDGGGLDSGTLARPH